MIWEKVREQFPINKNFIFLDLATKCALPLFNTDIIKEYIQKQQDYSGDKREWINKVKETRENVATMINAHPDEIAFTKNTSEGLNIISNGIDFNPGDNIVLNELEHPNNVYCWKNLEEKGVEIRWVKARDGKVLLDDLKKVVDNSTRVVALAHVNYSPGSKNDLKSIANFCRKHDIYTVIDAVQAVGTINVNVKSLGVDMLCTSGHKALFVPHGVGILYIRREHIQDIRPMFVARSSMKQETSIEHDSVTYELNITSTAKRFEIGNYNYLGLTALNESVNFLMGIGMEKVEERIMELNSHLTKNLLKEGINVLSPVSGFSRSSIVSFYTDDTKALYEWLLERNVITNFRRNTIRVSFGIYNNEKDIDSFIKLIKEYNSSKRFL